MQRSLNFSEGEYYHVYNRGVEKRKIFIDQNDYQRFVLLLNIFNGSESVNVRDLKEKSEPISPIYRLRGLTSGELSTLKLAKSEKIKENLVDIGVYCLMPNHFHFLIKEIKEGGITDFMHKLTTGYTMYFNKRYERVGSLFQGTFKAEHADTDEYLKYLYSYIHLNPIKLIQSDWEEKGIHDMKRAKNFLKNYEYSSYCNYHNPKKCNLGIINKKSFPEYFSLPSDFDKNIFNWINPEVKPRGNCPQNF